MRLQSSAFRFIALGILLLGVAAPLFAQVRSTLHPNSQAQREMQAREWALTHFPDEVNKRFKKEQVSLFAQIREDFTRLQVINNEMMQTVFVKRNIDQKLIVKTTSEINKRASRLSENLVLPRIDDKASVQKPDDTRNDRSLEARLLALDDCIMSFIANPLFKQPNVVDSRNALKARSDLNLIIRLSEELKTTLGNQSKARVPNGVSSTAQ
jgi:hypothetical protein